VADSCSAPKRVNLWWLNCDTELVPRQQGSVRGCSRSVPAGCSSSSDSSRDCFAVIPRVSMVLTSSTYICTYRFCVFQPFGSAYTFLEYRMRRVPATITFDSYQHAPPYHHYLLSKAMIYDNDGIRRITLPSFRACSTSFSSTEELAHLSGGTLFPVDQ
jgi:hypothetical protein